MAFMEMDSGGTFVAWGKDKAKENSYVVEKGESITGLVVKSKTSDNYGKILELKIKDNDDNLIILGTSILIKKLGYEKIDEKLNTYKDNFQAQHGVEPITVGDKIRITFNGMIPARNGKEAYDFKLEVDR